MIGYWRYTVICLSVCALRPNDASYSKWLNKWIATAHLGTQFMQLSSPHTDPIPWNFLPQILKFYLLIILCFVEFVYIDANCENHSECCCHGDDWHTVSISSSTCVFWLQKLKSYSVAGLHQSPITCFEWSVNGLKLFSGDSAGAVVCTEFDFTIVCTSTTRIIQILPILVLE